MAESKEKDVTKTVGRSVAEIEKADDLLRSMEKSAKAIGILFDRHTESIGKSVKDLTKMEMVQKKLENHESNRKSIELNMVNLLKERSKLNKYDAGLQTDELNKLRSLVSENHEKLKTQAKGSSEAIVTAKIMEGLLEKISEKEASIIRANRDKVKLLDSQIKKENEMLKQNETKLLKMKAELTFEKSKQKLAEGTFGFYKKVWNIFKEIDAEMFSIRKHFGVFRDDSKDLETLTKSLNTEFSGLGVTIGVSSNTVKAIGDNFNRLSSSTKSTYDNIALLSSQLGISEKISSDVLKNFAGISGKLLKDVSEGMMGFTQQLSSAAGTNLNEVMSDIADASDSVRATFRGNTLELIKTTVEARRMGLSLESIAKTADGLLDFNSSVNAEMEASVLLGKNLNLNEARRKAWVGDILGANKEILKVVKSAGDFDKMNVMQRKALAAAVGKSVEELQKMVTIDKEIAHVEARGTPEQRAQLALYRDRLKLSEKEKIDLGKNFEQRMKIEANQERMVALTNQFNNLLLEAGKPILDILEPILKIAVEVLPKIIESLKESPGLWKALLVLVTLVSSAITAGSIAMGVLSSIGLVFGTALAKSAAMAALAAGKIALMGTAIAAVYAAAAAAAAAIGYMIGRLLYMWTPIQEAADTFAEWLFEKWEMVCDDLLGGLMSVREDILDAIVWPFANAYEWLRKKWLGNSPSEIGLRIVDGIASIGNTLISYLTSPFTSAFTFITELFGKIPEFITGVFKRGFDFVTKLPGMGLLTKAIDTFSGNKPTTINQKSDVVQSKQDDTDRLILEKLTELTNLLKSGAIAVNLDGRKVSETLAYVSSR